MQPAASVSGPVLLRLLNSESDADVGRRSSIQLTERKRASQEVGFRDSSNSAVTTAAVKTPESGKAEPGRSPAIILIVSQERDSCWLPLSIEGQLSRRREGSRLRPSGDA